MKLFLRKKASAKEKILRRFAMAVTLSVLGCVVISQIYFAVSRKAVKVNSGLTPMPAGYVELVFDAEYSNDIVVLCNGEEYSRLEDGSMRIGVEKTAVIEVYNGTGRDVKVEIASHSPEIKMIADEKNIICRKGINYICRCIYTD